MAQATYTPTHCPQTGRKFTRAERKAANKAKFKSELAANAKPKRKRKPAPKASVLPSKPVPKATQDLFRAPLMRLTKAQLVDMILGTTEDVPTSAPKRKPKRKKAAAPKVRKATPQERVADRQDRAHHGRPDSPITPQPEPIGADVERARSVARATGARNRRQRAFELATAWAFDGTYGGMFLPTQQAELTRLLGSTEVSTYEDVVAITH